jgi:hypothetical protein
VKGLVAGIVIGNMICVCAHTHTHTKVCRACAATKIPTTTHEYSSSDQRLDGIQQAATPAENLASHARCVSPTVPTLAGGPVSALAEEEKAAEDKPKKKKLTPEEKAAEKARLEQQADENAQARTHPFFPQPSSLPSHPMPSSIPPLSLFFSPCPPVYCPGIALSSARFMIFLVRIPTPHIILPFCVRTGL